MRTTSGQSFFRNQIAIVQIINYAIYTIQRFYLLLGMFYPDTSLLLLPSSRLAFCHINISINVRCVCHFYQLKLLYRFHLLPTVYLLIFFSKLINVSKIAATHGYRLPSTPVNGSIFLYLISATTLLLKSTSPNLFVFFVNEQPSSPCFSVVTINNSGEARESPSYSTGIISLKSKSNAPYL